MKQILVCNESGGVGKTTFAFTAAHGAHLRGHKSLLVNMSRQISLNNWVAQIHEHTKNPKLPTIVDMPRASAAEEVSSSFSDYDYVFYDTLGSLESANWNIIAPVFKRVDMVVIPITPDAKSVWEAMPLVEIAKQRRDLVNKPYCTFFMSMKVSTSTLAEEITDRIKQADMPIMSAFTPRKVDYDRLKMLGRTLYFNDEFSNIGFAITDEVIALLEQQT